MSVVMIRRGKCWGAYPGFTVDLGVADGGVMDDELAGCRGESVLVGGAVEEGVCAGCGGDGNWQEGRELHGGCR